jgi:hypothetical protein
MLPASWPKLLARIPRGLVLLAGRRQKIGRRPLGDSMDLAFVTWRRQRPRLGVDSANLHLPQRMTATLSVSTRRVTFDFSHTGPRTFGPWMLPDMDRPIPTGTASVPRTL